MADTPAEIVEPPDQPGQPYDATDDGPVAGWAKLGDEFPDGPGPWQQV